MPETEDKKPANRPKAAAKASNETAKTREEKLAEALRANLRRRKTGPQKDSSE